MLRNLPQILSPALLYALRAMGHGDRIVIADANYPAESSGPECIRLDGITATDVLAAILQVMPLDTFVAAPAQTMQVVGDPDAVPDIVAEFQTLIDETADNPAQISTLERHAFYEEASSAFAVVQTGEQRIYGNIILTKGIIAP
ncbi:RbsD/FucU family protein [Roseibium sediminicola]|uniref:Ribose ABC transporter n=1 Tax=Roseibium sediminicola TaxID=2933272 RepID=A0ABT0GQM5_9HYPH|nr:RbsD/FucU domain-containing protein [Roseibium sp. CAU 1639]MCK7611746.1 ribose ABC transporter [Roseibium sp. CAU 1639]